MDDQQSGWVVALKWLGGSGLFAGLWKLFQKARNTNHADRITRLERIRREDLQVMADVRQQMAEMTSNVDIRLGSTERRVRQLEVNANDLDRMVRDNLQRMIEQIDRRLHNDSLPRWEQPEPPAQR